MLSANNQATAFIICQEHGVCLDDTELVMAIRALMPEYASMPRAEQVQVQIGWVQDFAPGAI
jgi:hypothetical protein